jgi:multimeric flavodoxin WrbA
VSTAVLLTSSRSTGSTRSAVDLALHGTDFAFEDINRLRIGYYSYDYANESDDFFPLVQRLLEHETWIIATPLYWYTMSAHAKTFLDRLSDLSLVAQG